MREVLPKCYEKIKAQIDSDGWCSMRIDTCDDSYSLRMRLRDYQWTVTFHKIIPHGGYYPESACATYHDDTYPEITRICRLIYSNAHQHIPIVCDYADPVVTQDELNHIFAKVAEELLRL